MILPDDVINRIQELASGISYGSIIIRINESTDFVNVSFQSGENIPIPKPGQIALENQRREG
jgi:hypothetical protein